MDAVKQGQYQVRFGSVADSTLIEAGDLDLLIHASAFESAAGQIGGSAPVIRSNLRNRSAVAKLVLEKQTEKQGRFVVAVLVDSNPQTGTAVGDFLAAGAVIDALAELGIDYSSPEAAAACVAFQGLKSSIGHILSASVEGRLLSETGRAAELESASRIDSSGEVVLERE
ncbi:MAG: 2-phosphosulfolactate phosphatase [Microbacteriaceae bacterium]|nr:2-phosphosulfolactate phosphatase [Microbacteriaceae bacterium]